jgi:RNA polymerase sigma factor (sigma-70 family)
VKTLRVKQNLGILRNKVVSSLVRKGKNWKFEEILLPHLNAAYNLARWLTKNEHDAEDVVQESYLRALNSFETFDPSRDGRAWLLKIVRNTCYTWLRRNRPYELATKLDEHGPEPAATSVDPETALLEKLDSQSVREAMESISPEHREAVILRELEGLSYKEIAGILDVPLGTVMSRLSRGRREIHARLQPKREVQP